MRSSKIYGRRTGLALLLAFIIYLIVWFWSRNKLLYSEELLPVVDFNRIAQGNWAQVGAPQPPLYVFLGSLVVRWLGDSLPALRLIGGLSFLATVTMIPWLAHTYIPDSERAERASLIAILIYVIHPLALQGSLLVDLDNTILTPVALLFVIVVGRSERRPAAQRAAIIGLAFALLLWTKLLPSPLFLGLSILLVYAGRRRWFASTAAGLALGLLLFLTTFWVFLALVSFPVSNLNATFDRAGEPIRASLMKTLSRMIMGGGITAVWMGIPFLGAFVWAVWRRMQQFWRQRQVQLIDILILSSAITFLAYVAGNDLPHGFPRYHYPHFVLMVLVVSDFTAGLTLPQGRERYLALVLLLANLVYFALVIPDPLLPQYQLTFETTDLSRRLLNGLRLQVTALLIPLTLTGLGWRLFRRRPVISMLAMSGIIFSLASWIVLSATQARVDYATIYEYGREGARQVSELVRQHTADTDYVVAPAEILMASGRDGIDVLALVCPECQAAEWLEHFQAQSPPMYILTSKEQGRYLQVTGDEAVKAYLARCYAPPSQIGSYLTFLRLETCQEL